MAAAPLISVVVPCHDLGRYLDECVSSVLAQSCSDFEILVVDDGSTDPETVALLSDYERPQTSVHRTENQGLARARNFLIERARGEYVCALDADDRLAPRYLEKALTAFEADPGLSFVSCWLRTFGDEEWDWQPERCDLPALLAECTVATPALVRRQVVLEVGGYDQQMPHPGYEDWALWLSLVESGHRGTILPEVLFHYRRRPGSMSAICCEGDVHAELMSYLISKHETSYRRYFDQVMAAKQREIGDLLRRNHEAERHLATWLEPELEARRAEVERLRAKLDATASSTGAASSGASSTDGGAGANEAAEEAEGELEAPPISDPVRAELARAQTEIQALRSSLSWRLTTPLRALYDLLLGARKD